LGFNRTVERRQGFGPAVKTMRILDFVGKILFPQQPWWERRRYVRLLFITALFVLVASLLGFVLVYRSMHQGELNPAPHLIFKSPLSSRPAGISKQARVFAG
jgi:hypothetical protein